MKILLALLILTTACAKKLYQEPNAEFVPYLQMFSEDYRVNANGFNVQFADLKDSKIGTCYRNTRDGGYKIEIDREWWERNANEQVRATLMYHELGHCLLNRGHDSTVVNGYPRSIMYPYIFYFPESMWESYVRELGNDLIQIKAANDCVQEE